MNLLHPLLGKNLYRTILYLGLVSSMALGYIFLVSGVAAQTPLPFNSSVSITLVEQLENNLVNVELHCDQAACDAVSLQIRFNPQTVQAVILSKGDFWLGSRNPVHILRERVDNATGLIEFMYVTENRGGAPLQGTGTLLQLGVIPLRDASPEFKLVAAEVASLSGVTVFRYTSESSPESTPALLIIQVELEAAQPGQISAESLSNPNLLITLMPAANNRAVFGLNLPALTTNQNERMVVFKAPAHLACYIDVGQAAPADTIVLRAGDVNMDGIIDISDAATMGLSISSGQLLGDINLDSHVDILDLIHIGRNYGARVGACGP